MAGSKGGKKPAPPSKPIPLNGSEIENVLKTSLGI